MEIPEGVTRLDIEQVIVSRYAEASNRLLDPHTSYTGMLGMLLDATPVYEQAADTKKGAERFHQNPVVIEVVEEIEALEQRVDPEATKAPQVRDLLVIQELEKELKSGSASQKISRLCALGIIAASNKPAVVHPAVAAAALDSTIRLKKPARETKEERAFRSAVLLLRRYAFPHYFTDEERAGHQRVVTLLESSQKSQVEGLKVLLKSPATAADAVRYGNHSSIRGIAYRVLERLFSDDTSRRDTLDELFVHREQRRFAQAQRAREEATLARQATIETGWDILGETAARELLRLPDAETRPPQKQEIETETQPDEIEEDRMRRLGRIVMRWGGKKGLHWDVAVAKLTDNSKRQKYRLVILRELDSDDNVTIEHAIGDVGIKDNVLLVLRGEIADWTQGAFDRDKPTAIAHGAKKMNHTPTLEARVWDYLNLPAEKLRLVDYDEAQKQAPPN